MESAASARRVCTRASMHTRAPAVHLAPGAAARRSTTVAGGGAPPTSSVRPGGVDAGTVFFSALVRPRARGARGVAAAPPAASACGAGALTTRFAPLRSAQTLLTAGLGTWQAVRYGWKVELLEERKRALDAPPVDVTDGRCAARAALGGHGATPRRATSAHPFSRPRRH